MTLIDNKGVRNVTIDIMKGIGIVCVVIGHSSFTPEYALRFIYAWHMPLFFILSGCFFKDQGILDRLKKDFRGLMYPYIMSVLIIVGVALVEKFFTNGRHFHTIILGAIYGTPRALFNPDSMFGQGFISALWFVPAMFVCRILYSFFSKYSIMANLLIMGGGNMLGMYAAAEIGHFPMGLFQAMCATIYFHIGVMIHRYNLFSYSNNFIVILCCIFSLSISLLYGGKVVFAACRFPSPLINLCGAIGAVLLLYNACNTSFVRRFNILGYMGRISLLILSVHTFDILFGVSTRFGFILSNVINIDWQIIEFIYRLAFAIFGALIISKLGIIRKIFHIPTSMES